MGQVVQKEGIIKGRDDAQGGHYSRYKGGVMQEGIIKGRDHAGGHNKREGRCTRRTL